VKPEVEPLREVLMTVAPDPQIDPIVAAIAMDRIDNDGAGIEAAADADHGSYPESGCAR
jgi:hypothetical protein